MDDYDSWLYYLNPLTRFLPDPESAKEVERLRKLGQQAREWRHRQGLNPNMGNEPSNPYAKPRLPKRDPGLFPGKAPSKGAPYPFSKPWDAGAGTSKKPAKKTKKPYVPPGRKRKPSRGPRGGVKRRRIPRAYSVSRTKKRVVCRTGPGSRGLRLTNREYIGAISSVTSNFEVPINKIINPGCADTFPWLSKIARNFETYQFKNLVFEYELVCNTSITGSVAMMVDHDVDDAAPLSWGDVCSSSGTVHGQVYQPHKMHVNKGDMRGNKRHVDVGLGDRHEDIGRFYICNDSAAVTTALGKVYVSYTIDLITPQAAVLGGSYYNATHAGGTTKMTTYVETKGYPPVGGVDPSGVGVVTFTRGFRGIVISSTWDAAGGISGGITCGATFGATEFNMTAKYTSSINVSAQQTNQVVTVFNVSVPIGGKLEFTTPGATATAETTLHFFEADNSLINDEF